MLGGLSRGRGAPGGLQEPAVRRLLQLLLHARRERSAVLEQAVPLRAALQIVALHGKAQPRSLAEIVTHQLEPQPPGRAFELRDVRVQHRHEVALALRDDRRGVGAAAHRVDGRGELGE